MDEENGNQEGQDVGQGHGIQNSVQPEENREQKGKADTEDYLADHGEGCGGQCFSHGLQKDEAGLIDAGQNDHAQINPEGLYGEFRIIAAFIRRTENGNQLIRKDFCQDEADDADGCLGDQQLGERTAPAPGLSCRRRC